MKTLSSQSRRKILQFILEEPNFLGKYSEYDGILTFLNSIWPLNEMPSEDSRFNNAYEDIRQHMVNNADWDIEYLFEERLKLIYGPEDIFLRFIEKLIHPTVRNDKDEVIYYVTNINSFISNRRYRFILTDYFEEDPVYSFKKTNELNDLPLNIKENNIPIFLDNNDVPNVYPSFILSYIHWNDYGFRTTLNLYYRAAASKYISIGRLKIMKRDFKSTWETLPSEFTSLSNDFCSLGQSKDYYYELKEILQDDFQSYLLAIRDVALFPKIHEQFENNEIYKKSLIRSDEIERLTRNLRFEIEGINPNEYFKFNYKYTPPFAENEISLNFNFKNESNFEHRIYAIIGKNGTGKTKILSSLAKSLSESSSNSFAPRKPMFGKVFTVSYSFFDTFEIPDSDASFNYIYCGLKKNREQWKDQDDLLTEFYKSADLIKEKKLENEWHAILTNFIPSEMLENLFEREDIFMEANFNFLKDRFSSEKNKLSSGQSITLYLISQILSHIRYDSLILFDEPETHLHPNAIRSLIHTLFNLTKRFQSFCVLATHSPLIIQEIPARNIFITERDNNWASIRRLEIESLGQNLTVINQEIFGDKDVSKHYIKMIEELVSKKHSYPEIIALIETENLPITSNIQLYIKILINEKS